MHGYSSSSESDDPKRPRVAATTSTSQTDAKKKKKKKPPPQKSVNRIWKKFQNTRFSKAVAVLPFDAVTPPASPERANEALGASRERATDECRRKVQKIIQDCKRTGTRYRDPGWDLDWDLKRERAHCLNPLNEKKFDISHATLKNPSASVPKAVKRVHEIFEKPTFMKNISEGDIKQGALGDCWAIAAMSSLALVPNAVQSLCVEYDTRVGIYGFVLYRDGEWVYSIIDDKLYLKSPNWTHPSTHRDLFQQIDREDNEEKYRKTYQTGSNALFFAKCVDQNETWLPLLEKAYAKAHGDYASLAGGYMGEAIEDITGGITTEVWTSDILDPDGQFWNEISKSNQEFIFGASAGLMEYGYGRRDGIEEGHAYSILEAKTLKSGQRLVKLRNPWGKVRRGLWEGAWSDGSKEWTVEVQQEMDHSFGSDSVFWMRFEDLLNKFSYFDRTRLFSDSDWRTCQRWLGVDVPWKASYHEMLHFKLTKDSPLVLVLSQLDTRYFRGLVGQYKFSLHFRVHELGRPGPEDYIVRSHGNYLTRRSVSIEVPDMPAGNYAVYICVTAERDSSAASVEDVVRRECKSRVHNAKFAQVGYAYDLAHSKAWAHLDQVAKLRKEADKKKASGYRMDNRRTQWEHRHVTREITRKQQEKNEAKAQRRRDEAEKAALEAAEKEKAAAEAAEKEKAAAEAAEKEKAAAEAEAASAAAAATAKAEAEATVDTAATTADKGEQEEQEEVPTTTSDEPADKPADTKTPELDEKEKTPGEIEPETAQTETGPEVKEEVVPATDSSDKNAAKGSANDDGNLKEGEGANDEKAVEKENTSESKLSTQSTPNLQNDVPKIAEGEEKKTLPAQTSTSSSGSTAPKPKKSSTSQVPKAPASQTVVDSSDSPVSDWEELYSSDDYTRQPAAPTHAVKPTSDERYPSEDEKLPDPWNAVCIVGFRIYSKDENLELRIVMEGGDLLEGGMGEKGAGDIDDAVENAGGERDERKLDSDLVEEGLADYEVVTIKDGSGSQDDQKVEEETKEQKEEEDGDDESEKEAPRVRRKGKKIPKKTDPEPDVSSSDGEPQFTPSDSDKKLC